MYCKHPEESCCNMTCYNGKIYCDNQDGFCYLHDEMPPYTNADKIRDMNDEELADFLGEWASKHLFWMCDSCGEVLYWLKEKVKYN